MIRIIFLSLLMGCASTPTEIPSMFYTPQPDYTKPFDWGRYNNPDFKLRSQKP